MQPLVGVVFPGNLPRFDFVQIDATGTRFQMAMRDIRLTESRFACYLCQPLAEGFCLSIYLSRADAPSFERLTALTNAVPSAIVRIPLPLLHELTATTASPDISFVIGAAIEPLAELSTIRAAAQAREAAEAAGTQELASRIAADLHSFAGSFGVTNPAFDAMLAQWLRRFAERFARETGRLPPRSAAEVALQ